MAGSSNTTPTLVVLSLITIIVILIVNIQTARDINDDLEFNLEKSQEKIVSEQVSDSNISYISYLTYLILSGIFQFVKGPQRNVCQAT